MPTKFIHQLALKSEKARFCWRGASHTSYVSDIFLPFQNLGLFTFVHGGSTTVLQLGDLAGH